MIRRGNASGWKRTAGAVMALGLVIGACSSSGDDDSSDGTDSTEAESDTTEAADSTEAPADTGDGDSRTFELRLRERLAAASGDRSGAPKRRAFVGLIFL